MFLYVFSGPGGGFGGPGGGFSDNRSSGKPLLLLRPKNHPQDHQNHDYHDYSGFGSTSCSLFSLLCFDVFPGLFE